MTCLCVSSCVALSEVVPSDPQVLLFISPFPSTLFLFISIIISSLRFLSSCDSPAVILNRCSSLDMMTHTRPLWFHTNRLRLRYGLPSFFSSVIMFPVTLSLCSLPHSFFLSYIHCVFSFFFLSACQALGLYCKYTHLHCYCWIVSVSSFFNPWTFFAHFFFKPQRPWSSSLRHWFQSCIVFIILHLTSILVRECMRLLTFGVNVLPERSDHK